jgi:erythronate-4-phosphate dehydrogenase
MKIIADQNIPYVRETFSHLGEINVMNGRDIQSGHVEDADMLLIRSVTKINAELLENSRIRLVASATSGTDHVDTDYLDTNGIGFFYAPGSNARSVAEYVLSSLFVLAEQNDFSLLDKTIAIIGCGQVGSCLLEFVQALGLRYFINDPPLKDETCSTDYCDLDKALSADIVTMHVPLTDEGDYPTRQMVNTDFLTKLKSDVIFINTSRGDVVDEAALKEFIDNNKASSIVQDVWSGEPDIDAGLLARVAIGTPHIAGYSLDGKFRATMMLYNQVCNYLDVCAEPDLEPDMSFATISRVRLEGDDDAIQFAALAGYDVRSDAASLRRMLEINEDVRGDYFDALRNNYPIRREFKSTGIILSRSNTKTRETLVKLGFKIDK